MDDDSRLRAVLRQMAWEKAKGELHAMLSTYWGEAEDFEKANKEVEKFIKKMEGEII